MPDTACSKVAREQTFFNWMDGRCRIAAAALAVSALQGTAQPQSVPRVAFDAVSIKPADVPKSKRPSTAT